MTQLPQDEFETCLEKAEAWMKDIHQRLKENDNTQGPRSALESRLQETQKICALEQGGKLLLEMVLSKAETLLGESSDDEKHEIHIKLGKIKAMFEETTTYMTHCHSRIEWVWLHWNEYLRAKDEFTAWVHDMTLMLELDMELQLGRKEKCWQYEQAQVLLRDVNNHSKLLDRLLEEASSLYNRIGDPSVDESVQRTLANEYKQIKKKTQERTKCLERIWRDHEAYEKEVNLFKSWLNGVIEKLKCCVGSASESTETRLNMLQEIGKDVEVGKKQLELLEERSVEVIKDTSPLGAEKICRELEELRRTLDELKIMNDEEEEGLLKTYNSENAFLQLARQLEANINEFRKAVQRLEESLESGERVKSEEELIALWKTLNVTKSALAGEEAKAERVKVQLKDLFKFSKDVQPLSDSVIAAMREYQRAKSKAFKLSTDTESELRQLFQNPLREFLYWKPIAESVLDSTAVAANTGALNHEALQHIEKLLEESSAIKEKLSALEAKGDGIHSVLGDERTKLLLRDVAAAEAEREALHRHLLERKAQLQSLAAQSEEFDTAFKLLHQKLSALRTKCAKENEMQPDIIGKEAQLQRLQILLDELTKLHAPIKELNTKMEFSPNHAHRASKLLSDYLTLQRSLENNIRKTKEYISCHWMFNNGLLDLQRWMMETRQEAESFLDGSKDWEERDAEALLVEVSEKDLQRHQVEAQGQLVSETSSPEGAAVIHTELKQLMESWGSLRHLCEQLSRSVKERASKRRSPKTVIVNQTSNFLTDGDLNSPSQTPGTRSPGIKQNIRQISVQDNGGHSHSDGGGHHEGFSSHEISISTSGISGGQNSSSIRNEQSPGSRHMEHSGSMDYKMIRPLVTKDSSSHSGPTHSAFSISTDIDGYSSSTSSTTDDIETSNRIQTGHTGNLSSKNNESFGFNITGKASASSSYTEVDSVHNEGSSRITSPARGSGSPDMSTKSVNSVTKKTTGGKSRIPCPAASSASPDKSKKSVKSSTEISTTNVKAGDSDGQGEDLDIKSSFKILQNKTKGNTSDGDGPGHSDGEGEDLDIKSSFKIIQSKTKVNTSDSDGQGEDLEIKSTFKTLQNKTKVNTSDSDGQGEDLDIKSSFKTIQSKTKVNTSDGDGPGHSDGEGEDLDIKSSFKIIQSKTKVNTRIIAGNSLKKDERNFLNTRGTSRGNRNLISLAESVDVVDSFPAQSKEENAIKQTGDDHTKLLMEFEQWLKVENVKLSRICAEGSSSRNGENTKKSRLQMLTSRVHQGQKLFEALLLCRPAMSVTEDLRFEDLRYRWMLYKSKLHDSGNYASLNLTQEPRDVTKKSGGICSFLHRVCCAALPLQLLLLLLLLLAFLLPLVYESQNCALANNFARSFNLMLKYDGPPPT
ncbi:nesprin-3 isoform X2 [Pyxicephalus adspersus]|uniref:nesprin-3 isoform X2 n=1 Tax=Pyxicephalus adspersus TaxID=30357 RepID=UPI003B5C0BB0